MTPRIISSLSLPLNSLVIGIVLLKNFLFFSHIPGKNIILKDAYIPMFPSNGAMDGKEISQVDIFDNED